MATPSLAQSAAGSQTSETDGQEEGEEVTVEGRRVRGYRLDTSSSATRIPIDVKTLPFSVQSIPAELLADQAALQLADAYRNVSGVRQQATGNFTGSQESAIIRGFSVFDLNRNGLPTRAIGSLDLATVETVDVLKGPASVTYGQVEPGGLINYTTKRPLDQVFLAAQVFGGSFDYYRGTLDASTPLNEQGTILARVVAAYTNAGSYRRFVNSDRFVIAPSIAFKLSDNVRVDFELSRSEVRRDWDTGVPFSSAGKPVADIRNYYGDPRLRGAEIGDTFATIDATAKLGEFTLRGAYVYHNFLNVFEALRPLDVVEDNGEDRLNRRLDRRRLSSLEQQGIGIATWKGNTGPLSHTLSIIADYRSVKVRNTRDRDNRAVDLSISVLNPTYDIDFSKVQVRRDFDNIDRNKEFGLSLSDQISLFNNRVFAFGGLRYDNVRLKAGPDAVSDYKGENVSFSGGLLVEAIDNVRIYGSYAQSFNARETSFYTNADGQALEPIRGEQIEVGIKADLLNESLLVTASAFEIKRRDEALYVFDSANDVYIYFNGGRTRSRGFELDVVGTITDRINVVGSYAYTDAEVVFGGELIAPGSLLPNVARHTASFWGTYELPLNTVSKDKITFGAGAFYTGERAGNPENFGRLPAYVQVDATVSYETRLASGKDLVFRLNVRNALNKDIYEGTDGSLGGVQTIAPRTIIGSIGVKL